MAKYLAMLAFLVVGIVGSSAAEQPGIRAMLARLDPQTRTYTPVPATGAIQEARSGCCSHHGGVAGCDTATGHQACGDGSDSPSCLCGE
jgi:hypothetical protein